MVYQKLTKEQWLEKNIKTKEKARQYQHNYYINITKQKRAEKRKLKLTNKNNKTL